MVFLLLQNERSQIWTDHQIEIVGSKLVLSIFSNNIVTSWQKTTNLTCCYVSRKKNVNKTFHRLVWTIKPNCIKITYVFSAVSTKWFSSKTCTFHGINVCSSICGRWCIENTEKLWKIVGLCINDLTIYCNLSLWLRKLHLKYVVNDWNCIGI